MPPSRVDALRAGTVTLWYRQWYYAVMPAKSLADLKRNPKGVRLTDLITVLADAGFTIREGTRHGYFARRGTQTMTIPRHHGVVKPVYVQQAIKFLEGDES